MFYTKIKFERLSSPIGSVEFSRDPVVPDYKRRTEFMQPVDFSDGGDPYIYDKGLDPKKYRYFSFDSLSVEDLTSFDYFYENIAIGRKNSFLFTDRDGSVYVARIWSSSIESVQQLANREALVVELLLEENDEEY